MAKVALNLSPPVMLLGNLLLVALVVVLEKFAISAHVYAMVFAMGKESSETPLSGFLYKSGGPISRILVLALVVFAVLVHRSVGRYRVLYIELYKPVSLYFLIAQVIGFFLVFASAESVLHSAGSFSLPASGWILMGLVTALLTALALAPYRFWLTLLSEQKWAIAAALAISAGIWFLGKFTQNLWIYLAELTFNSVRAVLVWLDADVYHDFDERIIGAGEFLVFIDTQCSGYEGIGLIVAFVAIFLYSFRDEFRFPRALLLFPIGIAAMWIFNVVRIVALILIGSYWSPEVAVWGFHSQAGWLALIMTSVGILYLAQHSTLFSSRQHVRPPALLGSLNLSVATLLPLVVLLASTLLAKLVSGPFNWLYPLQVVVVGWVIVRCLPHLDLGRNFRVGYFPLVIGALVALLWMLLVPLNTNVDSGHRSALEQQHVVLAAIWLVFRFVGAVITVPIAEELGFRAYLLCRLNSQPVATRGRIQFSAFAFLTSSIAFGLLHGAWLAGTVAGLLFALVRYRSQNIVDAIVAHGLANLLLFLFVVLYSGQWSLL